MSMQMDTISSDKSRLKEVTANKTIDIVEKMKCLITVLADDLDACDFKWTLFVTAANSYKYDSLLKPFPSEYATNKVLNINSLRETIAIIPRFSHLLSILQNIVEHSTQIEHGIDDKGVNLLYWCLILMKEPSLKSVNRTNFDRILQKVVSVVPGPKPTHIFEVSSQRDSIAEEKFRSYQDNFSTSFAYHGSKLESFHSILNYGLQQHLCKRSLYGEGIYLSSELHVTLMFSPTNCGWENSRCGKRNSCLAICEFVNHPSHLKCHTKEKNNRAEVPDKYFVITNNEIVRLRYLIVYGSEIAKLDRSNSAQCNAHDNTVIDWIYRHKWLTAMIIYTAILLVIGASNSRHGYYMRQYMRQATLNAINYIKTIDFMGLNLFQKIFN